MNRYQQFEFTCSASHRSVLFMLLSKKDSKGPARKFFYADLGTIFPKHSQNCEKNRVGIVRGCEIDAAGKPVKSPGSPPQNQRKGEHMPNHVRNVLTVSSGTPDIGKIREEVAIRDDDGKPVLGTIDFERIVPMP